ncbi:LuxR C-terminal-related transcriptional regulator [Streptomyces sp. NRRL F-2664]|uniref:LuxR C-terminal-related transcriptional regulator n=1 Tax=Streptomyces sp. NRRL F-2664 TaxID=1463842 RepID=UPI001F46B4C8|nr:LuxR C-terminal-related transcriptional regulator [Streptomyces sp. NRRL F-2664]
MAQAADVSPRESEVLELVGDHLSNAEIGARLYISVRTVETHVSSLLRKLQVPDRRALARRASERPRTDRSRTGGSRPAPTLPARLTSFIGRASERAALTAMLGEYRQVSAVGPGGVGKTRLALAVASDAADEFADGVWFVDLVPVTDPAMIATAVAEALGLGEQPGHDMDRSVTAALADRHALLVLDNCEHVVDGAALFLERLLAACPRVTGRRRWAGRWTPPCTTGSPRSAHGWTAWPWRSNWPPPATPRSAWTASPPPWPTRCACSPAAPGHRTGTAPYGRRWTGATTCWTRPTGRCCAGCRCS